MGDLTDKEVVEVEDEDDLIFEVIDPEVPLGNLPQTGFDARNHQKFGFFALSASMLWLGAAFIKSGKKETE